MTSASYATRPAGPEDADVLIGLFNRAFHKQKDGRTSAWKYFESPHGASCTLLAVGVGDGEDVPRAGGAYSYVFRRMTWRGEPFLGTQASDAMVDVEFRRRGIFTSFDDQAAAECARRGAPVCFAVAGRQSMHGFLGNGWRDIGTYRTYVAVLDAAALLRGRLGSFAPLLGGVVSAGLGLLGRRVRLDDPSSDRVVAIERFDDRVDRLWERVKDDLPLAGVRDAAYLNWRYFDTPTKKHRVLGVERDGELVAYVVLEDGHRRGYVVDLLGLDARAEDAALRGALRCLKERGIPLVFLSTLPCPRTRDLLRRNGLFPHPRRKPFRTATPFIVRVLREDAKPAPPVLLDPESWYVLDGDRDVEHVSPA